LVRVGQGVGTRKDRVERLEGELKGDEDAKRSGMALVGDL
jgi:hypothetical protein